MGYKASNNGVSKLVSGINNAVTSLSIQTADIAKFPVINNAGVGTDYTYLTLQDSANNIEIVKVTRHDTASASFTIVRGQDGTTARAWLTNDAVSLRLNALVVDEAFTRFQDLFRNTLNTITSFLTNTATAARTYEFPDKSGTVAMTSDITGTNSGTNTGDQGDQIAAGVPNTPAGSIAATNVQDAINELDAEKASLAGAAFTGPVSVTSLNGGQLAGNRNIIINGGFTINQRVYVSAAALASGSFGHDRWKGGASGGDYSFTQLASPTTITIAANKSLIQVVEDKNVVGGNYIISWTGTATGRVGKDTATPAGNFAVSPILLTGQAAGTVCSIEFAGAGAVGTAAVASATVGTLGKVQVELGAAATPFEVRSYGAELNLCKRYYEPTIVNLRWDAGGANYVITHTVFYVEKRALPTITVGTPRVTSLLTSVLSQSVDLNVRSARIDLIASGAGDCFALGTPLTISAEL